MPRSKRCFTKKVHVPQVKSPNSRTSRLFFRASLSHAKKCSGTACFSSAQEQSRERLERLVGTLWRILSRGILYITRQFFFWRVHCSISFLLSWRLSRGISRCRAGSMWISWLIKSCRRGKKRGTTQDSETRTRGGAKGGRGWGDVRGPERGRRGHEEGRRRMSRTTCPFSIVPRLATAFEITFVFPPLPRKIHRGSSQPTSLPRPTHSPSSRSSLLIFLVVFFTKMFHVVCAKTGDSIVSSSMYAGKARSRYTNGGMND